MLLAYTLIFHKTTRILILFAHFCHMNNEYVYEPVLEIIIIIASLIYELQGGLTGYQLFIFKFNHMIQKLKCQCFWLFCLFG